jgi:hypothetical protein
MAKKKNGKTSSGKKPANGKKSKADKPEAAYFLSLSLKNVRCFGEEEQTLDLSDGNGKPARWTLLFGNNGTGKTTALQGFVGFEDASDANGLYSPRGWGWGGRKPEISYQRVPIPAPTQYFDEHGNPSFSIGPEGYPEPWLKIAVFHGPRLACEGRQYESECLWFQPGYPGPYKIPEVGSVPNCYAYGASRRLGTSTLRSENKRRGRTVTLFDESSELGNAEEWILRADYSAKTVSAIQEEQRKRLQQAKDLLIDILPDVDDIRISEPTKAEPNPVVQFKTPYGWVRLNQLGYGYQTLIAWMVDFASRLFEQHPDSENPLAEPAVCLVDEIDLHLHPKWQREIMSFLSERFPNTQFIATAHSPLIAQAADENTNIAVLRREGDHVVIDNDVKAVHGWRIDQVLTSDLFELPTARPAQLDKDIERRKELLTKSRLSKKEKEELAELEERVGDLPAGDNSAQSRADMALIQETLQLLKQQQGQPS